MKYRQPYTSGLALGLVLLSLTLAACGTTGQGVKTVFVNLTVPVSCIPADTPTDAPASLTAEQLRAAPDAAARMQLLAQFWTVAAPELALYAGLVSTCRSAAPAPK